MCNICNRPDRSDIENAILAISTESGLTVDAIAEQYGCDLSDLRTHALFHTPLLASCDVEQFEPGAKKTEREPRASLARKVKLREVDTLEAVNNEYMVTLKAMGRRINRLASPSSIDAEDAEKRVELSKLLTKPMVDLYVGLGGEIRQNVRAMVEIDRALNGPQDNGSSGLQALADAIRGSGSGG